MVQLNPRETRVHGWAVLLCNKLQNTLCSPPDLSEAATSNMAVIFETDSPNPAPTSHDDEGVLHREGVHV